MENIKELVTIGKQYFDNKDYTRAEQYLKQAVDKNAKYADVFNMLGVISHVQGKFATAINLFRQALGINPRYTEAILNLAVLYNDLGQYTEAKKLYGNLKKQSTKPFCKIEPVLRGKLSNLHADIGDIYRSIGFYDFSIDEYEKALHLNPNYFDIRTKLGQALRENGKFDTSLKELRRVLRSDPAYCPALIQEGITFYAMEKIPSAKRAWKAALAKDPDNKYAQMYLRLCDAITHATKTRKASNPKKIKKPKTVKKKKTAKAKKTTKKKRATKKSR